MPHTIFCDGGTTLRVRKPPSIYTKTFLFRPGKPLHGAFSIGLAIETFAGQNGVATFEWCGSKRLLRFHTAPTGFITNLRLPQNLTPGDVYVLSVSGRGALVISVSLNGDEEAVESVAIEESDDGPYTATVCADPSTAGDRSFEDMLATDDLVKPAIRVAPVGRIESLRPFPDGGVLTLRFRRVKGAATLSSFLIRAIVGEQQKLGFMSAGQAEVSTVFRLFSVEGGETWPLTITADQEFTWSGSVSRNFDTVFLPAFSLQI
jgi:hypothetical protein